MGLKLTASFALLSLVFGQALAADVFYNIPIENVRVAPDGFPRDAIQAGTFPGQLIVAHKGDVLHLNVTNKLHWHGIFQDRTSSEDGPSFVTQCPIAPGSFYRERGTLVIYGKQPTEKALWDVDDPSTIITLADWYHHPAEALMDQFKRDGHEPVPDSGLINGVGRYVGGPAVPWAVMNVVQGKRYRFRVINISGFAAFTFSIDGHTFEVIETDGIATVPLTVSSFEIHAAQRYSIVLHANAPVKNYWIHAPMTVQGSSATLDKQNVKAILRYAGAPNQDPVASSSATTSLAKGVGPLQEFRLATLINPGAPGGSAPADHVIDLDFNAAGPGTWEINGIVYTPPSLPTLLNIINGATKASDFTVGEHTFILVENEVVELRIHGAAHGMTHPFHLHGHVFDVIKSAEGPENFVNPPRRDVVAVEAGGVIIRFRGKFCRSSHCDPLSHSLLNQRTTLALGSCTATLIGIWSEIDYHITPTGINHRCRAGLAVVFAEAPAAIRSGPKSAIIPPPWRDLCPKYNALPAALQ
ncbi:laccase [Mycena vulgaris]|nr:laccase [Mycena vulgaris]